MALDAQCERKNKIFYINVTHCKPKYICDF